MLLCTRHKDISDSKFSSNVTVTLMEEPLVWFSPINTEVRERFGKPAKI